MTLRRTALAVVLAAAVTGLAAVPAAAAPPPGTTANQFYYTVAASYQDAPETLWEIAGRFLGDPGRAGEILDLNSGLIQPDGGRVSDPQPVTAGWNLALPWDAVGADLHYGPIPAAAKESSDCARAAKVPDSAGWGQALLTPDKAWAEADGSGVKVAVIGSGVDGSAPELTGRVAAGSDVAAGTGRGDTDCKGTGTALAGIVAGDGKNFGVAPKARIVPIKAGGTKLPNHNAATALDVAAASGAQVVLVGAAVDATDPAVRAAIGDAIARDVVVVLSAKAAATPADGLLRVGAIKQDSTPAENYPDGSVDVLAPGVGVASIGRAGSGPEYAAAFVAGTAALVRSAHPKLPAADVARQVRSTADAQLVNPVAAVTTALPGGVGAKAATGKSSSGMGTLSLVLLWIGGTLVVVALLWLLLPRPIRMLTEFLARRRTRKQALAARDRLSDDSDDPFWEPPTADLGRPVPGRPLPGRPGRPAPDDEPTQAGQPTQADRPTLAGQPAQAGPDGRAGLSHLGL